MPTRRLIFAAVTLAYWTMYLVGVLEAVHYREHLRVLGPLATAGAAVGVGLLILAVRCWPATPQAPARPPVVAAARPVPMPRLSPGPATVEFPRPSWGSGDAVTRFMDPVRPDASHPGPVARAVAVAEMAETVTQSTAECELDGYVAAHSGTGTEPPDDGYLRGFATGAVENEDDEQS